MHTMTHAAPQYAPSTVTGSLSERAMTVSLHLKAWQAKRIDRRVTAEVLADRNAQNDAGEFVKNLMPPSALDAITKAHSRARQRHYAFTLPWGDEGVRILASTAFFEYTSAMNGEERPNCEQTYKNFLDTYEALRAEAPRRLGKLYTASEFPTLEVVKEKFGFTLTILPVPDKSDFRVEIGDDAASLIRESIEETVNERYAEAQRDLWTRLSDTLRHFHEAMADPKQVFRNTTVTKLAELATLAPKLSLTPDPKLEEICASVSALLSDVEPNDFRENQVLRRDASKRAKATLAEIDAALAGAF